MCLGNQTPEPGVTVLQMRTRGTERGCGLDGRGVTKGTSCPERFWEPGSCRYAHRFCPPSPRRGPSAHQHLTGLTTLSLLRGCGRDSQRGILSTHNHSLLCNRHRSCGPQQCTAGGRYNRVIKTPLPHPPPTVEADRSGPQSQLCASPHTSGVAEMVK